MQLNTIKAAAGAKHAKKRVGRGIGSGTGKTAGLGHKGQRARAGGYHKTGFEGGQMPLQRRLPKRGFISPMRDDTAEVRLSDLNRLTAETIDILALKEAGVVPIHALSAKVIVSGEIKRSVNLHGLLLSKGAKAAIEAAGGTVEFPPAEAKAAPKGKAAARAAGKADARAKALAKLETQSEPTEEAKAAAKAKAKARAAKSKGDTQAEPRTDAKAAPKGKAGKEKPGAKKAKKGE